MVEILPYGYGRMCISRTDHIYRIRQELTRLSTYIPLERAYQSRLDRCFLQLNRVKWYNDRAPIPYREYDLASQTTDYLRSKSSVNLVDCLRVIHLLWKSLLDPRQMFALLGDIAYLLEQVALYDQAVYDKHIHESAKAWEEEMASRGAGSHEPHF